MKPAARRSAPRRPDSARWPTAAPTSSAGRFRRPSRRASTRSVSSPTIGPASQRHVVRAHSRFASALLLTVGALVASTASRLHRRRPCRRFPPTGRRRCSSAWPTTPVTPARCKAAPFGFRYQYLAGGVNTGSGWSTWNPNGSFVDDATTPSRGRRRDPGAHATTSCSSRSRTAADEANVDLANLDRPGDDGRLLEDVRCSSSAHRGAKTVVAARRARPLGLHRAGARRQRRTVPASCPGAAAERAGFAQECVALRNAARAERDPRLPHERLGNEARHPLREAAERDRARVRGAVGGVLPLARTRTSTSPSRTSPTETPATTKQSRTTRTRGSSRPTSPGTCSTRETFVRLAGHPDGRLADPARQHASCAR